MNDTELRKMTDEEYIRWKDLLPWFNPIPTVNTATWNEEQKSSKELM
jgi:hypothetical protein